jgi:hypothetical protein
MPPRHRMEVADAVNPPKPMIPGNRSLRKTCSIVPADRVSPSARRDLARVIIKTCGSRSFRRLRACPRSRPGPSSRPDGRTWAVWPGRLPSCGTSSGPPWSRGRLPAARSRTQCPVTGGQDRGAHPAAGAIPQQVRPRLRRLPVPVGQGDELLAPVGAHADHHQQAQLVLFQPDVHMDPVGPQVDVVHTGQVPLRERALFAPPGLGQQVITAADSPAGDPRNWPSAGTKSPLDRPCKYSNGSTSVVFGVLRHQGGKIAEENRFRSSSIALNTGCSQTSTEVFQVLDDSVL